MEKILKLSYYGLQIMTMLISMGNQYISKTQPIMGVLKDHVRHIEETDYEEFSFIRILSDSVDKTSEEFLEVIDVAIQDLITSLRLGEL